MLFSPTEGRLVQGPDGPGRWRVRSTTIRFLQSLDSGFDTLEADLESAGRASRLLAAYLREILGSEPPTLALVFPDLAGGRV